ncbi:hypothetical protein D3C76_1358270 [compost metagenome]
MLWVDRAFERVTQLRVQRQHRGQGAVAFDQGVQGCGIQRQLLIGTGRIFNQGLAHGVAHGQGGSNGGTGDDQHGVQRQAQGSGSQRHAVDNRKK